MPSTHRTKIRRKDLKQPDEFMTMAAMVEDFVEHHLTKVIVGAVAVLIVAAAAFAIYRHEVNVRHRAAEQFYQGFRALDSKNYAAAQEKLKALIAADPSSSPGRLARFYLGLAYLRSGDKAGASRELEAYTQDASSEGPLREMALMDLGAVYEEMREYDKAVQTYEQAAGLNGPNSANASLAAARVLEQRGKRDQAIAAYQKLLKANPYGAQRQTVIQALANLGVSVPATDSPAVAP
jgi:tetratricopeptide (TPR) repeat protein